MKASPASPHGYASALRAQAGATDGDSVLGLAQPAPPVDLQRLFGTLELRGDDLAGHNTHLVLIHHGSAEIEQAGASRRVWPGSVCISETRPTLRARGIGGWLLTILRRGGTPEVGDSPGVVPVDMALRPGIHALGGEDQLRCRTFLEALDYELSLGPDSDVRAQRALLHLVLLCCARVAARPVRRISRQRNANRLAEQVLRVIEHRFAERLSLAEVADELSRSKASVARAAREATGKSVVELIAERRMREARGLLLCTDTTVSEIAARVGYPSTTHFHRAFRRIANMTPQMWRAGDLHDERGTTSSQ